MNASLKVINNERPRTRAECVGGERPCVFASCRNNLAIELSANGEKVRVIFPDADGEPDWDAMPETCSLDVADRGPHIREEIALVINTGREFVRQIEERALRNPKLVRLARLVGSDPLHHPSPVTLHTPRFK